MLGFSPFKKHANRFNYIPRYYDPEKDAREQRRAELRGERAEDSDREYRPGQYIRTQREARDARREQRGNGMAGVWKLALGVLVVMLMFSFLFPRLMEVFYRATSTPVESGVVEQQRATSRDEFDQSHISDVEWQEQKIEIVPNDYQE